MSKELYGVTLQKLAWVYVEAESVEEAMKIAEEKSSELENYCGWGVGELDFEGSEISVDSAETYGTPPEDLEEDQLVIVDGKIGTVDEFYNNEDNDECEL